MLHREYELKWEMGPLFDLDLVTQTATASGKIAQTHYQSDYVFAADRYDVLKPTLGVVIARVRESNDKFTMTVKRRRASNLDRTEAEVDVSDAVSAKHILRMLGLEEVVVVRKRRTSISLGPRVTCNIDQVTDLGTFVEFEWLLDIDEEVAPSTSDLIKTLTDENPELMKHLDLVTQVAVRDGYDTLLLSQLSEEV